MNAPGAVARFPGYASADRPIPIAWPLLPPAAAIAPYLAEIDGNRWYSNHGPLAERFSARLAHHAGVPPEGVALVGNATIGIALALEALGAPRGGRCLMPAWTFVATPAAAIMAGLDPHFLDIDPETWMPDPEAIAARDDLDQVSAIVVVAPFGRPFDTAIWEALSDRLNIPVVIDGAAAFDALRAGGGLAASRLPIVLSLHATKSFGIGEGGALVSTDVNLVRRFRSLTSFGFNGDRVARAPGINAKISEYSAAVGLAAFDRWPVTRAHWARVTDFYLRALAGIDGVATMPGQARAWVGSTFSVVLDGDTDAIARALSADGVATVRWWSRGCQVEPAYAHCRRDPLPVTNALGSSVLGLPFHQDMSAGAVRRVVDALAHAIERSDAGTRR